MRCSAITCVALAVLSAPALGQELVVNGDFSNQLSGWSGSGPGKLLGTNGLTSLDVNGQGASPCFGLHPGGNTFNPPHPPYKLATKVGAMVPGRTYEVTIDVAAVAKVGQAQGGMIEAWVAGTKVAEWTRFSGNIPAGTFRDRLCGRFKYRGAVGAQTLEVHLARPLYVWHNRSPQFFIDNVSLRPTAGPTLCHVGERSIGGKLALEVHGEAAAAVAVFLAPKTMNPVQVPGISGALELDLVSLSFLLAGPLDAKGMLSASFPIPNVAALQGMPIWWQGLQITKTGAAFGGSYNVAVY